MACMDIAKIDFIKEKITLREGKDFWETKVKITRDAEEIYGEEESIEKERFIETQTEKAERKFLDIIETTWQLRSLAIKKITDKYGEGASELKAKVEAGTYFITLRPEKDFKRFYYACKTLFKEKCIKEYKVVWEQIGEDIECIGKGFHIHSIVRFGDKTKGFQFWIDNLYKKLCKYGCGDIITKNNVDVKPIRSNLELNIRELYIDTETFHKGKTEKKEAWDLNQQWREQVNLKECYTCADDWTEQKNIMSCMKDTPSAS